MTGLELALLGGAIGGLARAGQTFGAAQDLRLTPEQKKRLMELERRAAADELGMTAAERERFRVQALTPVQAAEREAMSRFAASQAVGDIGQGAAFRQQQALKDTGEAARAQIKQAEVQQAAFDEQRRRQELDRLQAQEQQRKAMERQAALQLVGTAAEGISTVGEKKYADELYDKRMKQLKGNALETSLNTAKMLGIQTGNLIQKNQQDLVGASVSKAPQALGTNGSTAGAAMIAANVYGNQLEKGTFDHIKAMIEQNTDAYSLEYIDERGPSGLTPEDTKLYFSLPKEKRILFYTLRGMSQFGYTPIGQGREWTDPPEYAADSKLLKAIQGI